MRRKKRKNKKRERGRRLFGVTRVRVSVKD